MPSPMPRLGHRAKTLDKYKKYDIVIVFKTNKGEKKMKNIKDLKIKSKEGFEVKNLQRFPSMEWGDEGGLKADIYYNGFKILEVLQEGNGGCAICYKNMTHFESGEVDMNEVNEKCLEFLKRNDTSYTSGEYDWLTKKTPNTLDDDDFEALVNCFEKKYDDNKFCQKQFKKNFHSVAILDSSFKTSYLSSVGIMSDKYVEQYLEKNNLKKEFPIFKVIKYNDNLQLI